MRAQRGSALSHGFKSEMFVQAVENIVFKLRWCAVRGVPIPVSTRT